MSKSFISIKGAKENNLKNIDVNIQRNKITLINGLSGSGKSSLAFDTIATEANRRFFYTISHYSRQFLDVKSRPNVGSIDGLSPTISLKQNATNPSARANIATSTDLAELLGLLFTKHSKTYCPVHDLPTYSLSKKEFYNVIYNEHENSLVSINAILNPTNKTNFKKEYKEYLKLGYLNFIIDNQIVDLNYKEIKDVKNRNISLVIDCVKIDKAKKKRVIRAIENSLDISQIGIEIYKCTAEGKILEGTRKTYNKNSKCEKCGFKWPEMSSKYFSINSSGRCQTCNGLGYSDLNIKCSECEGIGLTNIFKAIYYRNKSVYDIYKLEISQLISFFSTEFKQQTDSEKLVIDSILSKLKPLIKIGLTYLNLGRHLSNLSSGDYQRLRIANILNDTLKGVIYILDEPSQGLHPKEIENIISICHELKKNGNTVIIVDHDKTLEKHVDQIITLGPKGGKDGGEIVSINQNLNELQTQFYNRKKDVNLFITLENVKQHNLNITAVDIAINKLNIVTGVSGSGKSSLIIDVLQENIVRTINKEGNKKTQLYNCTNITGIDNITNLHFINRKNLVKNSNSFPATFLDIYTDIRKIYSKTPLAQLIGLEAKDFSLSSNSGRCLECKGRGKVLLSMKFLADVNMQCPSCQGKRYQPHILDITYKDKNIDQVLSCSLNSSLEFFKHHKKITTRMQPAIDLGLGYLKLGQLSSTLSGGEAQRLKLAPFFSQKNSIFNKKVSKIIILEEPTRGLHNDDIDLLINCFRELAYRKNTVIIIDNNTSLIKAADWMLELGPGPGDLGGRILHQGMPYMCMKNKMSVIKNYL